MRGALSECVCVRLWPLCAPVNRSQCARGRQNWKFPPHPISDRTARQLGDSSRINRTPNSHLARGGYDLRSRSGFGCRSLTDGESGARTLRICRRARGLGGVAPASYPRGPARGGPPRIVVHALPRQIGGPAGRARVDPGARPAGRGGLQSPLRSGSRPTDWPTEYSSEFLRAGRVEPCRARLTTTNPNRSVRGASRRQCSL